MSDISFHSTVFLLKAFRNARFAHSNVCYSQKNEVVLYLPENTKDRISIVMGRALIFSGSGWLNNKQFGLGLHRASNFPNFWARAGSSFQSNTRFGLGLHASGFSGFRA